MSKGANQKMIRLITAAALGLGLSACGEEKPLMPPPPPPPEYADKHMPDGYWGNADILEEGKAIFTGAQNIDVNCASCHGKDGKPVKAGARDFRQGEHMAKFSDAQWFWRVSEGIQGTKMKAWKSKLSEEAIWKVIVFEASFGLQGQEYSVAEKKWVPAGTAKSAEEVASEPVKVEATEEAPTEEAPK